MAKSLGSTSYMQDYGYGRKTDSKVGKHRKKGRVGGRMRKSKKR